LAKFLDKGSIPSPPPKILTFLQKPPVNNWIRAKEIRVIDADGKNLGVLGLAQALKIARERGLDLIQATNKVQPPVCKIGDYGKYLYRLQKKEKKAKVKKVSLIKEMRLGFNISPHDMETKAGKVGEFLKEGNKVRIEMILRGREKALQDFAREKVGKFLEMIKEKTPIKIERELKRERRGAAMIIARH